MERTTIDLWVGAFVAVGFAALLVLALKVGNIGGEGQRDAYRVEARFDNIGGLKVRAPVKAAGVVVGRVQEMHFDNERYQASVTLALDKRYTFPKDTTASILTSGLLGEVYIGLDAGGDDKKLAERRPHRDHAVGGGARAADRPVPLQQGAGRRPRRNEPRRAGTAARRAATVATRSQSPTERNTTHDPAFPCTRLPPCSPPRPLAQEAPDALVKQGRRRGPRRHQGRQGPAVGQHRTR